MVRELGPALLAVYSRPLALVKQVLTFMNKFTHMLMPTAGALGAVQSEELKGFYVDSTKYSMSFTLPALATLMIFGDVVLHVWMGKDYVNHGLMILLAVGYLLPIAQDVSMRMVIGVNRHGLISVVNLLVVLLAFIVLYAYFSVQGWSVMAFAVTLLVPLNIVYGVLLPVYTCKALDVSVSKYLFKGLLPPLVAAIPFLLCMLAARLCYEMDYIYMACGLFFTSGFVLFVTYFNFLLGQVQKQRVLSKLPKKIAALMQRV